MRRQFGKLRQAGSIRKGCDSPPGCSWMPAGPCRSPAGSADYPPPRGRGPWGRTATACEASGPDQAEKELGGPGKLPPQRPALSDPSCPLCPPPARTREEPSVQPARSPVSSQASRALIHYVPFGYLFIHSTAFIGHQQRTCPGVRGFQAHPCYSGVGLIIITPRPPWAGRQDRE